MFYQTYTARRPPKDRKMPVFVPGDLDLWPLTLTFKFVQAKDQTRLPFELGADPFSGSRDISYTNREPQTDGAKNRTFCSSLRVVIITGKRSEHDYKHRKTRNKTLIQTHTHTMLA